MGSRVLSRSFNVEKWNSVAEEDEEENTAANSSHGSEMDVDNQGIERNDDASHHSEAEGEEDATDDSSDVTMVPMADMLNARYGSENAKLFYEEHDLKMVTTKPIRVGEQIWNTYGDLPNAELLRRYGHVDVLPLPNGMMGNPVDAVEINADIVVNVVAQHSALSPELSRDRIDWWLDEGGEDVFAVEPSLELPPEMVSLVRLLLLPLDEWEKARNKGKPPQPKFNLDVLNTVHDVLNQRLKEYLTTIEEDEKQLAGTLSPNKKHATIVRLGEKRILDGALRKVNEMMSSARNGQKKRKGRDEVVNNPLSTKKSRR